MYVLFSGMKPVSYLMRYSCLYLTPMIPDTVATAGATVVKRSKVKCIFYPVIEAGKSQRGSMQTFAVLVTFLHVLSLGFCIHWDIQPIVCFSLVLVRTLTSLPKDCRVLLALSNSFCRFCCAILIRLAGRRKRTSAVAKKQDAQLVTFIEQRRQSRTQKQVLEEESEVLQLFPTSKSSSKNPFNWFG
eukprot:g58777.t1